MKGDLHDLSKDFARIDYPNESPEEKIKRIKASEEEGTWKDFYTAETIVYLGPFTGTGPNGGKIENCPAVIHQMCIIILIIKIESTESNIYESLKSTM